MPMYKLITKRVIHAYDEWVEVEAETAQAVRRMWERGELEVRREGEGALQEEVLHQVQDVGNLDDELEEDEEEEDGDNRDPGGDFAQFLDADALGAEPAPDRALERDDGF